MATLTADLLPQLNIELRDTDNFTFTVAEKTEAIRKSIEDDPMVYKIELDNSSTTSDGVYTYDSPFITTLELGYDAVGDGTIEPLPRSAWEDIDGTIYIDRTYGIPSGRKLYMKGVSPLTSTSNISQQLRSYIVANAVVRCVDMLMESKVNRFNRNDSTMAEMQMVRQNRLNEISRLRPRLRNKRSVRF